MRSVLFTLMSLACTVAMSTTVYKWVDENGVTHYSDQPHENAQKVEVQAPQTYSAPPLRSTVAAPKAAQSAATQPYRRCALTQPANDETFVNAYSVAASVVLEPPQRQGDQVLIVLDGQRMPGLPTTGTQFTISPVDRGEHSLQALVQDSSGQVVCRTASVTFQVHQPSVQSPTNPVRPRS